ncbi:MAG: glycosyltransferase [Methanobacteriaceae archaeon]|nr:glycosyltransferase [Methanobacteriaceae archaeon]
MKDISIIITTYNAKKTIRNTILSVLNDLYKDKIEIIIVDDYSSDETVSIVADFEKSHANIKFIKLNNNSGGPSKPRNIGISNANGHYITFLDDDDKLNMENLLNMVNYAKMNDLDCIKGYIKVIKGKKIIEMNRIMCDNKNSIEVIKNIISGQSTTADIIVKREFLNRNNIRFNSDYKVGEDTVFYTDIFVSNPKIEYYDSFFYYNHKRDDYENLSTTQLYQDNELNNHISVWNEVENKLKTINVDYFDLRLHVAVKNTINSIIYFSNGKISEKSFSKLSNFLNENKNHLNNKLILHERYDEIYRSILLNDYEKFLSVSKKRLIVTGFDLKFIKPVLKYLEDDYNIQIDEWTGHNTHNEQKSIELLNWTDFIFCEWLLGNSVWYSKKKMNHQKLIIRAHKFELTRDFGNQVNYENVNGIIAVSYYYLEKFTNQFKIPRHKMILLSNYVDTNIFNGNKTVDCRYNIALVGYVPKWKGLMRGLKILKMLKEHDNKFKLHLIGKNYNEVDWILNNPEERSYFKECENFIKENRLEDSVEFKGWMNHPEIFNEIGYVLSLSDIESFHLAPAEGLVDLTLAFLLNWNGVEYVYPEEIIFDNIDDIKDMILSTYDNYNYYRLLKKMRDYVITEFNVYKFVKELKINLKKIALLN